MATEFDLIQQYFTRPTRHTNLSVGDDAALISIAAGMELAISADMLVAGTHFFPDADPYQLGWKSLAVNVSDMAAMGASAQWATLTIALPNNNTQWLSEFSRGFFACAAQFDIDLIGGDTTRGPLTISVQIMGEAPTGKAIKRSGAKAGDEIWVSGNLGNATLALAHILGKLTLTDAEFRQCESALHNPQPRVALGLALRDIANSAIDISDGLLADLGHILERSGVGATLQLNSIPRSACLDAQLAVNREQALNALLTGGDDYELCFTASAESNAAIVKLGTALKLPLSMIGKIQAQQSLLVQGQNNEILDFKKTGFDHFD